jgi:hypothetical protein
MIINVVTDYNAIGDGKIVYDGSMSASSSTLTSNNSTFTSADIGKVIRVAGAGPINNNGRGGNIPLAGTIQSVSY